MPAKSLGSCDKHQGKGSRNTEPTSVMRRVDESRRRGGKGVEVAEGESRGEGGEGGRWEKGKVKAGATTTKGKVR